MYKINRDGISVRTMLDKRKSGKSGLYPIKICVTYKRLQQYYITRKQLSVEDWEKLSKTKVESFILLRESLRKQFNIVANMVEELADKQEFSFENLRQKYNDETSPSRNIDILKRNEI